jgi:hypothetical protein
MKFKSLLSLNSMLNNRFLESIKISKIYNEINLHPLLLIKNYIHR